MTDSAIAPSTASNLPTPASVTGAGAGVSSAGSSPLDVLDQILSDAQAKTAESAQAKAAEEAHKLEEEHKQHQAADRQMLEEELERLKTVKQSPQYQARIQQDMESAMEDQEQAKNLEGNEILQIAHTKIAE
jgi:hypothetical protein